MTILAPEVVSDIEAFSEAKKVHWEKHLFRGDDLSSYGLIVTACGVRKWQKRCSRHRRRAISFIMLQIFLRWGIAHCRLLLMQGDSDHRFYEWSLACDGAVYERVAFSENPRRLWPVAGPGGKDESGNERKNQHQRGQRSLLESCFY